MQFRCDRRKCLLEHGFNLSTPASLACFKAVLPTLVSWSVLYVCAVFLGPMIDVFNEVARAFYA